MVFGSPNGRGISWEGDFSVGETAIDFAAAGDHDEVLEVLRAVPWAKGTKNALLW